VSLESRLNATDLSGVETENRNCIRIAVTPIPSKGFEPLTGGLEIRCSIQLSYEGKQLQGRCTIFEWYAVFRNSTPRSAISKTLWLAGSFGNDTTLGRHVRAVSL
jgi:hypothetical protein